ncbi:NAD(P)H-dependent flavin oxidoreductase [Sphingomonas tabacisoli]|uniref:Propionate 3-nitronate monooxygenase n=1 Tax=Sphingomonas tabacisoli TaxID=2249466 RepID=A0ABW4I3Q6_9SPHN
MHRESDPLLDMLGIRLPIIQAPMAGVSTPAMAAAVTQAGGVGSLGVGATDADGARRMIADVRALSSGPVNINVFCHAPAIADAAVEAAWIERFRPQFAALDFQPPAALTEIYQSFVEDEAMYAMLLEERPAVVSFHFGLPRQDWIDTLKARGIVLLASATNLDEARAVDAAGIHAVIAQGWEAGGHRGTFDLQARDDQIGTLALTRLLVRELHVPVIAAGGIMDGAGVAATLKLGAAAALLGTAFIACDESQADAGYRAALAGDAAHHTVMTRAISGRPARCLPNRFTAAGANIPDAEVPSYPRAYDLGKALHAAGKAKGEFGFGAQWAGQGAPLSRSMSARQLVETLAAELNEADRRERA